MERQVLYSYYISIAASMGALFFGYQLGSISGIITMDSFKKAFLTNEDGQSDKFNNSLVGSAFQLGCIPTSILLACIGDRIGRKVPILAGGILGVIGIILEYFNSPSTTSGPSNSSLNSISMMCAGRFVCGMGCGILSSAVPIFISEIVPTKMRGALTNMNQLMITFGIFLASVLNSIIYNSAGTAVTDPHDASAWRIVVLLQLIPAAILLVVIPFVSDSPVSLLNRGYEKEALVALSKHRCADSVNDPLISQEFNDIRNMIVESQKVGKASWSELLEPSVRRRVVIASILQIFQQISGINAIIVYSGDIFNSTGASALVTNSYLVPILFFVNFISTFPSMYLIDRSGRSKLLVIGGYGMAACFVILSVCFIFFSSFTNEKVTLESAANVFSIISLFAYMFFFAFSWGPVVWTYQSEIFPIRVRTKAAGIPTLCNWFLNFIMVFVFPIVQNALKEYVYLPFLLSTIGMATFSIFFVPETKGLEIDEIDVLYGKVSTPADFKTKA